MITYNPKKYTAFNHPADQYAKAVLSGKVTACRFVKLACLRHLNDRLGGMLFINHDPLRFVVEPLFHSRDVPPRRAFKIKDMGHRA